MNHETDPSFLFILQFHLSTGLVIIHAWRGGFEEPNHTRIDCEMSQNGKVIFSRGATYCGIPRGTSLKGNEAKELVTSLFAMKPGDTDEEYFDAYTPEQLDWAIQNGEELNVERECEFCDENGNVKP